MLKDLRVFHEKRRYIFGQIIIINEESILEIRQKCHPDCQVDGGCQVANITKKEKWGKTGQKRVPHNLT